MEINTDSIQSGAEKGSPIAFLKIFGLMKVVRVLKLGKLINKLNVREETKMVSEI